MFYCCFNTAHNSVLNSILIRKFIDQNTYSSNTNNLEDYRYYITMSVCPCTISGAEGSFRPLTAQDEDSYGGL